MELKDSKRAQRKRLLGIDCPGKVVWKDWEAGEEYVKTIVIKNVDIRAQTITYQLPERKATFLTPYPEPSMLSSGMHMELEIRFCPTQTTEVHDCIKIDVAGRGSFVVYLEALPPHAKLTVPASHDFEWCAVSKRYTHSISVKNTGTVPLSFYWEVSLPFSMDPDRGMLQKDECMQITISFIPTEASAVLCQAVCKMEDMDNEVIATIKLSGVGKYPFIRFQHAHSIEKEGTSKTGVLPMQKNYPPILPLHTSTSAISFEEVVAGSTEMSEFYVENPTVVPAEVSVRRVDDRLTAPFQISPTSCVISREGCQKFKVLYRSISGGSLHINTFALESTAGNTIYLETRGSGVGPKVKCSSSFIDFGNVNLDELSPDTSSGGNRLTRVIQLTNMSDCVAPFQFLSTAPGAAFTVEPYIGAIPAKGKVKVKVVFCPTHPMNYLRRLIILVHNSADALYLDCIGSAYDSFLRPLPFDMAQVELFYIRLERGLGRLTPDALEALATCAAHSSVEGAEDEGEEMLAEIDTNSTRAGSEMPYFPPPILSSAQCLSNASIRRIWRGIEEAKKNISAIQKERNARLPYHKIFVDPHLSGYPFHVDVTQISFGSGGAGALLIHPVSVYNYTNAMALASWCVPAGSAYSVAPLQQDVPPFSRAEFMIRFHTPAERGMRINPASSTQLGMPSGYDLGQYLECYVNFKQMRSFRLCCERSFTPPHCFTVQVNQDGEVNGSEMASGSGTRGGVGSAESLLSADPSVFFPPVRIGETAYQVLAIENSGDVVMTYESAQAVLIEVSDKVADDLVVYETDLSDGSSTHPSISASSSTQPGQPFTPSFAGRSPAEGPSDFGTLKSRTRTLSMSGENALQKMYKRSEQAGGAQRSGGPNDILFTCFPAKGILHPGQKTLNLLKFSPTRYARYRAEITFRVSNLSISDKLVVGLRGESHIPRLAAEEISQLTFRPTCITGNTSRVISVVNPTCFPISYQLVPSPELDQSVSLYPRCGTLPRGERVWVTATFRPCDPRVYSGFLSLVAVDDSEEGRKIARALGEAVPLLKEFTSTVPVIGEGMYGAIEVEPISIDCGQLSKGEEDEQVTVLTIYNSGLCAVQFELRVMIQSQPKEWIHAAKPPRLRNHTGVLPARSHTQALITVYPCAGVSTFLLYVMIGGVGTPLRSLPGPMTIEEAMLLPHSVLTIRGTSPAIQIEDARSLSLHHSHLWRQLNINAINEQLSGAVVPSDVEDFGFAFPQNIYDLVPISVDLGVGSAEGTPFNYTWLVQNTGDCPVSFAFWLPMENDVNVEHWFQDDENLKDMQYVVDKNIIEINPRKCDLNIGGSVAVTLTYRCDSVGVHKLPVLLRVSDSKKVLLMLEGRTLPQGMEALAFHHPSAYDLLPVKLGDMEPPLQSITIENPMDHEVSYEVQMTALQKLADDNFGFPILQCVTPTGVLSPHSLTQVSWYFRPLEAKVYHMDVPILTNGGEAYHLTFTGMGFHPHKTSLDAQRMYLEKAFLSLPVTQRLSMPSLPLSLSVDVLRFGAIPYFSLHRRQCILRNHHRSHTYSFQWDARHPSGDHVLTVQPMVGVLKPGEEILCKVTLYSGSTSQMIEWPLTCHITNETLLEMLESNRGDIPASTPRSPASATHATAERAISSRTHYPPSTEIIAAHGTALKPPVFQRTTCTKPYLSGGSRKPRKSVTNIPLESLSLRGLMARVKAERRREVEFAAAALEDEASEDRVAVYNSLELLLQTRIMPREDYERLHGSHALRAVYQPVKNILRDPRGNLLSPEALGPIPVEDASVVRDILDELLRHIIAHPKVQGAFTEPFIRSVVRYQDCAACAPSLRGQRSDAHPSSLAGELFPSSSLTSSSEAERQKEESAKTSKETGKTNPLSSSGLPTHSVSAPPLKGFMGNVLEEALEQMISNMVGAVVTDASRR